MRVLPSYNVTPIHLNTRLLSNGIPFSIPVQNKVIQCFLNGVRNNTKNASWHVIRFQGSIKGPEILRDGSSGRKVVIVVVIESCHHS